MSLEQDTNALSQRNLQLVLTLVFLLKDNEIFFIKLFIFITFAILLLVFGVLYNSVLRLLDELEDLFPEEIDTLWLKEVISGLFKDLLDGLSLGNQAVGLGFCFHGLDDVVAVLLGHLVDDGNVFWSSLFGALQETWKSTSTCVSNIVASIELSKTQ
jgi:hypothetical protein